MNHKGTDLRPSALIDEWLAKYGYDKRRYTSPDATPMGYARLSQWDETRGERVSRWSLINIADNSTESLFRDLFSGLLDILKDDQRNGLMDKATIIEALLLVSHGEGRWAVADPDDPQQPAKDWDDLDDDFRKFVEITSDPEMVQKSKMGMIPCRIVNIIADTGLGAEVTMFPPTGEVMVERHEQYAGECEPESCGIVDDALMSLFAFVLLIEQAVHDGESMDFGGLLRSALASPSSHNASMVAYLLRLLAKGYEAGILGSDDFEGFGGGDGV